MGKLHKINLIYVLLMLLSFASFGGHKKNESLGHSFQEKVKSVGQGCYDLAKTSISEATYSVLKLEDVAETNEREERQWKHHCEEQKSEFLFKFNHFDSKRAFFENIKAGERYVLISEYTSNLNHFLEGEYSVSDSNKNMWKFYKNVKKNQPHDKYYLVNGRDTFFIYTVLDRILGNIDSIENDMFKPSIDYIWNFVRLKFQGYYQDASPQDRFVVNKTPDVFINQMEWAKTSFDIMTKIDLKMINDVILHNVRNEIFQAYYGPLKIVLNTNKNTIDTYMIVKETEYLAKNNKFSSTEIENGLVIVKMETSLQTKNFKTVIRIYGLRRGYSHRKD